MGSHLLGASGFGFTFLWFGFGPEGGCEHNIYNKRALDFFFIVCMCALNPPSQRKHVTKAYFLTIKGLNSLNVVFSQWVTLSVGVDGVHEGARVRGVGHTEGVA